MTSVHPAVRRIVLRRDGGCFGAKVDPHHVCRDQWGLPHAPDDERYLTMEHVKEHLMMGRKAPSDEAHLVAMCNELNVGVPTKELRAAERAYLTALYPEVWRPKGSPVYKPGTDEPSEAFPGAGTSVTAQRAGAHL